MVLFVRQNLLECGRKEKSRYQYPALASCPSCCVHREEFSPSASGNSGCSRSPRSALLTASNCLRQEKCLEGFCHLHLPWECDGNIKLCYKYKSCTFLELLQVFKIKPTKGETRHIQPLFEAFPRIFPNYQIFVFQCAKSKGESLSLTSLAG